MSEITVKLPATLTRDMICAVRDDPTTKAEDWETWQARLGWLVCAWEVLLRHRLVDDPASAERSRIASLLRQRGQEELAREIEEGAK